MGGCHIKINLPPLPDFMADFPLWEMTLLTWRSAPPKHVVFNLVPTVLRGNAAGSSYLRLLERRISYIKGKNSMTKSTIRVHPTDPDKFKDHFDVLFNGILSH